MSEHSSIRLRLLKWLLAPVLLINLAGGVLTYALAWLPAQSAFDQSLLDGAGALGARLSQHPGGAISIDLPGPAEQVLRADQFDAIYFVVRGADGQLVAGDADFPPLRHPGTLNAPSAYDAAMRGEAVRIVGVTQQVGTQTLQLGVAKTLRRRQQLRSATLRTLILLEVLLTLASSGLVWFSVTNGLRPLHRLRAELNARGGDVHAGLSGKLSPIGAAGVPYELEPVVGAFNGLLERLRDGATAQHEFLANVAHQLRTPLAGLQTQLELLAQRQQRAAAAGPAGPDSQDGKSGQGGAAEAAESAHATRLMLASTARMIRQTNQLLALARAEPSNFEVARLELLALDKLVEESIQHFVDEAAKKSIDLGFELHPTEVLGDRFLLRDLIDNLIDNAIRYTPAHGVVTVRCRERTLQLEDSGPGIAPDQRALVLQRFVRLDDKSTGSGLGLAIVSDIVSAHGATLRLDGRGRDDGPGLLLTVHFPGVRPRRKSKE